MPASSRFPGGDADGSVKRGFALAALGGLIACALAAGCGEDDGNGGTPLLTGHATITGPTSAIPANSSSTGTASCPAGDVVIGGGYTTANPAANVFDSFPATDGAGWTVSVKNENLVGSTITLTPFAVCVDRPGSYEIRTASTDLSKGERKAVSASCADLTWTLVGGGYNSGDPVVNNYSSSFDPADVSGTSVTSVPTKWISEFRSNYSVPASSGVDSFAICIGNGSVSTGYIASPAATVGPRGTSTLTAACDGTSTETTVASAGITATVSHASTFDSSPPAPGSWTAMVHNPQSNVFNPASLGATLLLVCVAV